MRNARGMDTNGTADPQHVRQLVLRPRFTDHPQSALLSLCVSLAMLVCLVCSASNARADVDMTGRLAKVPSLSKPSLEGVQPLTTSATGDYECLDKYSVVGNWYYYFAIGNCRKGWEIDVVSYASENTQTHEHSYGGFVTGAFSGCGWIDTRYPLEKVNSNQNSACGEEPGNNFKIAESKFMEKHNGGSTGDGYAVVNKKSCPEYANYRPWSTSNVEQELVRTAPAYAASEPGSNFPALKWRYTTKYDSTDNTGQYVMVRDDRITGAGEANWVFVPRSCLPSTLPENENERIPPEPAVTTEAASGVQTPDATLNGTVNPEGIATTYYFQYGTTTSWNESSTSSVEAGSGTSTLHESVPISGLQAGTTYYYRIVATGAIGTSQGSAQAFTTQPPPSIATNAATEVGQMQAVVNGTVNSNGLDTHYDFQYGTTTSYGSSTGEVDIGSGASNQAVNANLVGLSPDTLYHYRIAASSAAGTSYGNDQTFTTIDAGGPSAIREPGGGTQWIYYVGSNSEVCLWGDAAPHWAYENYCPGGGQAPARGTSPSAIREPGGGTQWIYYVGSNNEICLWGNGAPHWTYENYCPGGGQPAAPGTSPAAFRATNGIQWIYYVGSNNEICLWGQTTTWTNYCPGGGQAPAPGTSISVVGEESGNTQWIYYVGSNSEICLWGQVNGTWTNYCPGGGQPAAPGTSPAVFRATNGIQWIYYVGSNNEICLWGLANSAWTNYCPGGGQAPAQGTGISVVGEESGATQWVYYAGSNNDVCLWGQANSTWTNYCPGGGQAPAGGTGLSAIRGGSTQWIYYVGSNNEICLWGQTTTWTNYCPGGGRSVF